MFVQSTQCRFWMFASEAEIQAAQQNAHNQFVHDQLEIHGQHAQVMIMMMMMDEISNTIPKLVTHLERRRIHWAPL